MGNYCINNVSNEMLKNADSSIQEFSLNNQFIIKLVKLTIT
jgi:hypothetical protein